MKYEEIVKAGDWIRTKGARDRIGLRRVVEVTKHGDLLVDHYRWKNHLIPKEDGTFQIMHSVERAPYSSYVMPNKIIRLFEFDENRFLCKITVVKKAGDGCELVSIVS